MSERKVLNKYYPPDFDPTKLPKLNRERNKQFVIRIMAPFSMQCKTCGEYIYKGRKFNSRMETAEGEDYLGLRIYRFHIRCTKCIAVITFKTDPENTDYLMEHGATRLFEAWKKLEQQTAKEKQDREDEETNNPMKALENRTRDSKREMESLEKLEELRDLNQRAAGIDPEALIHDHMKTDEEIIRAQEQEDEDLVKKMFGGNFSSGGGYLKRIIDSGSDSDGETSKKSSKSSKRETGESCCSSSVAPTDIPGPSAPPPKKSKLKIRDDKLNLSSMIRPKKQQADQLDGDDKDKSEETEKIKEKIEPESTKKDIPPADEVKALPVFKINLKKDDPNNKKMKGTSLSLLGGYDSSEGSDGSDIL